MLTVGLWIGARAVRRGRSIEEACDDACRTFGAWKGALTASLIGAQWLAGRADRPRRQDIDRVVSALARWQPVRLQERRA